MLDPILNGSRHLDGLNCGRRQRWSHVTALGGATAFALFARALTLGFGTLR